MPSLQKTDGNLQDAPRIKNCLKAALLPFEFKTPPPSSPAEILEKAVMIFSSISLAPLLIKSNRTTENRPDTAHECCEPNICLIKLKSFAGVLKEANFTICNIDIHG